MARENCKRDDKGRFIYEEDLVKPGEIYESNSCGKFEIVRRITQIVDQDGIHDIDTSAKYFCVRFLNTGTINIATTQNILEGAVKDIKAPLISNVGYLGVNIHARDQEFDTFYRSWIKMIKRCYDPAEKEYNNYGAIGVTVEERWHSFINFFNDSKFLPNYEKKILHPDIYHLDKDYLQLNIPKNYRIYSHNTCMFLSRFDNIQIRNKEKALEDGHRFFGVKPNYDRSNTYITSYSTQITVVDKNGKSIRSSVVACFKDEFASASLYNYIYPFITRFVPFHEINILNNITPIPYNDLINLATRTKNDWFTFYPTWDDILKDWNTNEPYRISRK